MAAVLESESKLESPKKEPKPIPSNSGAGVVRVRGNYGSNQSDY